MMTDEQRRKAIEYAVLKVFVPPFSRDLAVFCAQYGQSIKKSMELSISTGMQISYPPMVFDFQEHMKRLIDNLDQIEMMYNKDKHE